MNRFLGEIESSVGNPKHVLRQEVAPFGQNISMLRGSSTDELQRICGFISLCFFFAVSVAGGIVRPVLRLMLVKPVFKLLWWVYAIEIYVHHDHLRSYH